jgi:hypothetical protein
MTEAQMHLAALKEREEARAQVARLEADAVRAAEIIRNLTLDLKVARAQSVLFRRVVEDFNTHCRCTGPEAVTARRWAASVLELAKG